MRKSLCLLMIVMAVISFAFVSCDASTAPKSDILGEIIIADSQSRGINVASESISDVESLYWYYKAVKTDGGLFNTGATNGFVPVKQGSATGLSGVDLGKFSYGDWTFYFCGVKNILEDDDYVNPEYKDEIESAVIVYSGNQTINVDKDKNFLNLTLSAGAGLSTEIVFGEIYFQHDNINTNDFTNNSFSIAVQDTVEGEVVSNIITSEATVSVVAGKVSFTGLKYNATGNIADGKHVMKFTLTQNNVAANIAKVATYELPYTVKRGYKYTIQGDLTPTEVKGNVEVGAYVVDVPVTTASLVLPVNSSDSKIVVAPANQPIEVTTMDLTVKYPNGVKLTQDTNTAGSGDNITADAKIGFMLNPNVEGGISVSVIQPNQDLAKYELTLNVDDDNTTLVEVSKFIGKNLEIEGVYHSSVPVPYYSQELVAGAEYYTYDSSNGILKLYVKHASPIDIVTKKTLAVAEIGDRKYTTLEAALVDAVEGDTIKLGIGEYAPVYVNKKGITIKGIIGDTREESTVMLSRDEYAKTYTSNLQGYDTKSLPGNLLIVSESVTIDSIWFDATVRQTVGDYKYGGAFNVNADNCVIKNCVIEGSGTDNGAYASDFFKKNITVMDCTFRNFERGIYHMGDHVSDPQLTITGNTFDNVRIPFDTYISQPLSSDSDSYINISGNEITGSVQSYIQVWDLYQWYEKDNLPENPVAGIKNVTLNNHGNIIYYLTHFNMLAENTGIKVTKKENQEVRYRNYVEIDSSVVSQLTAGGYITYAGKEEITDWDTAKTLRGNYIYMTSPGNYELYSSSDKTKKIMDFTVSEQVVGTIQRIVAPKQVEPFLKIQGVKQIPDLDGCYTVSQRSTCYFGFDIPVSTDGSFNINAGQIVLSEPEGRIINNGHFLVNNPVDSSNGILTAVSLVGLGLDDTKVGNTYCVKLVLNITELGGYSEDFRVKISQ